MKTAPEIVYDYLEEYGHLEGNFASLLDYVSSDTAVGWFVDELFELDEDALVNFLGEENAKTVLDYYEQHC